LLDPYLRSDPSTAAWFWGLLRGQTKGRGQAKSLVLGLKGLLSMHQPCCHCGVRPSHRSCLPSGSVCMCLSPSSSSSPASCSTPLNCLTSWVTVPTLLSLTLPLWVPSMWAPPSQKGDLYGAGVTTGAVVPANAGALGKGETQLDTTNQNQALPVHKV